MASDAIRVGRAALFDLLADLLLHELDMPLAEQLAADPALAEALQPPTTSEALSGLRADYANLFLLDLPPYSSVILDVPPVIGGESTLRWERAVASLGLGVPSSRERAAAPDHAGLVMRALAAAERVGRVEILLPTALAWLPQWVTALQRDAQDTFYGRTAALVQVALGASAQAAQRPTPSGVGAIVGAPPEPEERDLRTLSRWLCTPAWSGWFLSKRRLRQLARPFGGGLGIVERDQLLQHAFEASGLDGRTNALLAALRTEWSLWHGAWREWHEALAPTAWVDVLTPWNAQLAATDALLTQLQDAARTAVIG